MIDLGLSKLAIIGVVALIVIGPEKLPKVARMAGTLYGRAQRYLHDVKSEVSREIELEELRNLQKNVQEQADSIKADVENSIQKNMAEVEDVFKIEDSSDTYASPEPGFHSASTEDQSRKAKEFRRKRLVRTSAVPLWYKQRNGGRMHVVSGAARVARFRPRSGKPPASFY
ncbi:Sec-independent protein translocase protein TatB [Pseudoduganella sp. SL102]|uniref:Sec-independent protein translocase protein TatB n=1 Tax=Pseudoduganella albidiflava TaxID=321983 RepID=A0A411X6F4_9BURK|nr:MULTISPECIES: Sec-independent protein translocase protein TatB [Pseudoduganella]QBI04569.1 Sec-independent protein translocase subunit TatB [Pseudoduganella albidiflava]WBS02861.1 Sec-independent protein translocase protein TatB [Pseudoduganella sp. SL102]GGY28358.1 sec-independent protein translocase protein TatB [Pseudoduganella albidiflava]